MQASATEIADPLRQLGRWTLWSGFGMFVTVGLLLALRRFATPEIRPLDPLAIVTLVAGMALAVLFARTIWLRQARPAPAIQRWLLWLLPTFCLILFAAAVSTPHTSHDALGIAWLLIAGEEAVMLWRGRKWLMPPQGSTAQITQRRESPAPTASQRRATAASPPAEVITQSIERQLLNGVESVSGTLRTRLVPQQRSAYVHIGFCPPLPVAPTIEFEQTDGPDAEIKLAQTLPHGARFDVRLKRASVEVTTVEIAFHAAAGELQMTNDK